MTILTPRFVEQQGPQPNGAAGAHVLAAHEPTREGEQPLPDGPPTWTDTTPATGTLTPAASGLTATELTTGVGADTATVSLAVGGTSFSASIDLTVQDVPQVLTSVQIAATVV